MGDAAQLPAGADANRVSTEALAEETLPYQEIDRLQELGINAADLKKLKEAGYHTSEAIVQATRKELLQIKGLSDLKVDNVIECARQLTSAGFMKGTELVKKMESRVRLTTGSPKLDGLLGGGVESQTITELYGEFRCGKSQICHSLAVRAQFPANHGGGNGKTCYIDTEGSFRPERITQIAEAYGVNAAAVLDNIMYARCHNADHLLNLLVGAASKMVEEKFSLLVVDSIMAPFRTDYSGRGELSERQQHLGKALRRIQKLAEEYNVAVVLTNQVMADPAAGMTFAPNPPKPVGGHVLAHASMTRVQLRKGRAEQRVAKLMDSPWLPEGDATFEICAQGIADAKE